MKLNGANSSSGIILNPDLFSRHLCKSGENGSLSLEKLFYPGEGT